MGHQAAHSPYSERDSAAGSLNVASVFAQMFSELQYLATRPAFGMSGAEALAGLTASLQFVSVVQSVYLNAIRAVAAHPEVVGAGLSGKQAVLSVLTTGLRVSGGQAARDYAAAMATADTGRLPRLGRSLLEGAVHREHVDVAASAVEKLPKGLGGRVAPDGQVGWTVIDRLLDERAREGAAGTVKELGVQLREVLDPDRVQDLSEDSFTRRRACHRVDEFGMFDFRFVLDPATGVQVAAALEAAAAPRPAGTAVDADGQQVEVRDDRSAAQRLADAFVELVTGPGGGDAAVVAVTATLEQVAEAESRTEERPQGAPVPEGAAGRARATLGGTDGTRPGGTLDPSVLARLGCDSPLYRILLDPSGSVLDVGHAKRLATPAQRQALAVRGGGCVVPVCGKPAEWCEPHHVIGWPAGGRTDLDNLVLLCSRHHTAVHAGVWQVRMRDGIPWLIPPRWRDPDQTPLRNTTHDHYQRARTTGRQVRLRLDEYSRPQ